jgi:hypothetical protein
LREQVLRLINTRRNFIIAATLSVAAIISAWLVFAPRRTLELQARSIARGVFAGDESLALSLVPRSDLKRCGVTIEQWKSFVHNELMPRVKLLHYSKEKDTMQVNKGLQGVHYFTASSDGFTRDFMLLAETDGNEAVVPMSIWISLFSGALSVTDLHIKDEDVVASSREIERRAISILVSYGIKGMVVNSKVVQFGPT